MWSREDGENCRAPGGIFWTPPPRWETRKRKCSIEKQEPFHMIHKVPSGDSPYVRAKHAQMISKDPDRAISLFWAAINTGDRVDSALKDMAVVMKQLDRSEEGIEAIKSFRYLCPFESQDSIDNLLLDLYKKSGRIQEEAELLEHKLKTLEQDNDSRNGGRITIAKRSHGKQINTTIEKEKARILGNLAWVHLQLHNYGIAEQHYRNALSLEPDNNKQCNLAICLMRMDRIPEAKTLLEDVKQSIRNQYKDEGFYKSFERATEMLAERERAATVADKDNPKGLMTSSSSSSDWSYPLMKEKQALHEPRNMYKEKLRVSGESVNQNSPVLITQPREYKWVDEEVDHRIGAARRLRFGKFCDKKDASKSVETADSTTNAICVTSKTMNMCSDLVKEKESSEKGYRKIASGSSSAYAQIMDFGQRTV